MSAGTDKDDRLKDRLAWLAAGPSRPLDYRLAAPDEAALIAAVLEEVDAAVLGRALDIQTEKGGVLGLDIAGRRLLRVRALPPGTAGGDALVGKPLSATDTEALAALRAALAGLVRGGGPLRITLSRLATPAGGADIGCAAATLAEAWAAPDPAPSAAQGRGIAGFVEACSERASAWVVLEGGAETGRSGPDADCARLLALSHVASPLAGVEAPASLIIGQTGGEQVLFRGKMKDAEVLLIHPVAGIQELRNLWRAALPDPDANGA